MKLVPRSVLVHFLLAGVLACVLITPILHSRTDYLSRPRKLLPVMRDCPVTTLHEGLPHQHWERQVLFTEMQSKPTLQAHDFHFYTTPMHVTAEDDSAMRRVFETKGIFCEWSGYKLCGGFHPDWLLEWTAKDGTRFEMLLCFGCNEAKVFGPNGMSYYDLKASAAEELEEILKRYRKQRPARKARPPTLNP